VADISEWLHDEAGGNREPGATFSAAPGAKLVVRDPVDVGIDDASHLALERGEALAGQHALEDAVLDPDAVP